MNRSSRTIALIAGLAGATLLTGCGSVGGIVGEVIQKAMLPSIAVGECTNLESSNTTQEVTSIVTVPCDAPHKWETFAEKHFDINDEFPGQDGLINLTEEFCSAEFATFVGTVYEESAYELQYLFPTEDSWQTMSDRTITCLIGHDAGEISGTLKGAEA